MPRVRSLTGGKSLRFIGLLGAALVMTVAMVSPANAISQEPRSLSASYMYLSTQHTASLGATVHGCPYYDFCAYSGENFSGTKIEMFYCQYYGMPFGGNGSFVNNQTPGTVAKGYGQNYNYIWNSGKALSQDGVMEWTQIWYVKPC